MGLKFANNAVTTIASPPSPALTGLSFTVADGSKFPALASGDYFYGTREDASGNIEIVKVEARSGNTMTIAAAGRGVDGTSALTWAAGDLFELRMTNIALNEILAVVEDPEITALFGLTSAANKLPYYTGSGAAALADFTARGRSIVASADHAAARAAIRADFEPAVKATFHQAAAPLRWTRDVTYDNAALRIVSGAVASGGADAFTSVFGAGRSTSGHAITSPEMPYHAHGGFTSIENADHVHTFAGGTQLAMVTTGAAVYPGGSPIYAGATGYIANTDGVNTNHAHAILPEGDSQAHSHAIPTMNLKYVDVLLATKDADA